VINLPFAPYIIFGQATDSSGNNIANATITLKNLNSGETLTTTSNSSGQYVFDCANFESGWYDGDEIQLYTTEGTFEIYATHNGGQSWYQIENEKSYTFDVNGLRTQINQTHYPGARTGLTIIYPI
jgi:hypothetical protein